MYSVEVNLNWKLSNEFAELNCHLWVPGVTVGLKNWLRITFAVELPVLKEGLQRMKVFSQRHAKKQ